MANKETYRQPSGAAQAGSIEDWEKLKARLETDYENLGAKKFEEKHGNSYRSMLSKVNDALKDATFKGRAEIRREDQNDRGSRGQYAQRSNQRGSKGQYADRKKSMMNR